MSSSLSGFSWLRCCLHVLATLISDKQQIIKCGKKEILLELWRSEKKNTTLTSLYKPAIKEVCWKSQIYQQHVKFMDTIAETWTSPRLSKLNETQVQRTILDGGFRLALGQKWGHPLYVYMTKWTYFNLFSYLTALFYLRHYFPWFSTVNQICDVWSEWIHTKYM